MATYGDVVHMQGRVNAVKAENRALENEIYQVTSAVNSAHNRVSGAQNKVLGSLGNASSGLDHCDAKTVSAYELQGQIEKLFRDYKQMELANKKIRELNNKKFYDFNVYRKVRKIVAGVMDNIDYSMVDLAAVYKSVEREHLKEPDYWLTCALIALMAWMNDDRDLANRALNQSYKLDTKNTCMFFVIVYLRLGRYDAVKNWFLDYMNQPLTGEDDETFLLLFSLVAKNFNDKVETDTIDMINTFIYDLIDREVTKEGYTTSDLSDRIVKKFLSLVQRQTYELPVLSTYCQDYSDITHVLDTAAANLYIYEYICSITMIPPDERNTFIKEYLNELLAKPNATELETYQEIERNQMIIDCHGDVEQANIKYAELIEHRKSDFNIINMMIEWILDSGNEHISNQMRFNMFTLTKSIQEEAVKKYVDRYHYLYKSVHPVKIRDYETTMNFLDEAGEARKSDSFYEAKKSGELANIKDWGAYIAFGAGALCIAGGIFLHPSLFAGVAIGGLIGGGILFLNSRSRKSIAEKYETIKDEARKTIHSLVEDHARMRQMFDSYDEVKGGTYDELATL